MTHDLSDSPDSPDPSGRPDADEPTDNGRGVSTDRVVEIADVSWSVGSYEPPDSPLVEAVTTTAADVSGERVCRRSAAGGGDAKTFRHADVPTVEFGFGTDTVHAVDEYTTIEALRRNAAVYARLPVVWASTSER